MISSLFNVDLMTMLRLCARTALLFGGGMLLAAASVGARRLVQLRRTRPGAGPTARLLPRRLALVAREVRVLEAGVLVLEDEIDLAGRPVALLRDDQLRLAGILGLLVVE